MLFDRFFSRSEAKAVLRTLEALTDREELLRFEVERHGIRFRSHVTVRRDMVVVPRPPGLRADLPAGVILRMRVPDTGRELRLEVVQPRFRPSASVRVYFICHIPEAFVVQPARLVDRYDTRYLRGLRLHVPSLDTRLPVLDVSVKGCRVDTSGQNLSLLWMPGVPAGEASLNLGGRLRIALTAIIPRSLQEDTAGLEFDLTGNPRGEQHLRRFADWLSNQEDRRYRLRRP